MLQNLKKRNKSGGFTIIEVMIVLAIAGLIMLIIFLAVPALQRSSHNTNRKEDIGRLGAATNDFVANNNGTMPVAADNVNIAKQAGTLGQYCFSVGGCGGSDTLTVQTAVDLSTVNNLTTVKIDTGTICGTGANVGKAVVAGATSRNVTLLYAVETGSGSQSICAAL